jgi:beta-1,4-mannosyltransferase
VSLKQKAYIFPNSNRNQSLIHNPYIDDFNDAFAEYFNILNAEKKSNAGFFDVLKFAFQIKYLFLNWIEDLPDKKLGNLQALFYLLLYPILKIRGVKIVFTLHNKAPHSVKGNAVKLKLFAFTIRRADFILTHASDGVELALNKRKATKAKPIFFHHPVTCKGSTATKDKKYDFLIWGTIAEYKGIDKFLDFYCKSEFAGKYKILIKGKIPNKEYKNKIMQYASEDIHIEDAFIDFEKLYELFEESRFILFTYQSDSVLSSGALMDSLCSSSNIIGPNCGAFKDLEKDNVILTFNNYIDIFDVIKELDSGKLQQNKNAFIKNHQWNHYAKFASEKLLNQ